MTARLIATALLTFVPAVACGGGSSNPSPAPTGSAGPAASSQDFVDPPAPTPAATPTPSSVPAITISSPTPGAELKGGDLQVVAAVQAFSVVPKFGAPPVAGEGHVVFYLDVASVPTSPGQRALTSDENSYKVSAETSVTWTGIAAGNHKLAAQLVNNDNTPLDPPAVTPVIDVKLLG